MKYILLLLLGFSGTGELKAQQDYFVFIQQPQGQPFYVRMGEDSYSSSATGHLILGTLKDSLYDMYIGFPRSRYPEQLFRVPIEKKDKGYELLQVNGRWQLSDLQAGRSIVSYLKEQDTALVRKTDSYSELMAGLVDDSSVLYMRRDSVAEKAVAIADSSAHSAEPMRDVTTVAPADSVVTRKKGKTKGKKARQAQQEKAADSAVARTDTSVTAQTVAAVDSTAVKQAGGNSDSVSTANTDKEVVRDTVKTSGISPDSTTMEKTEPGITRDPRDIIRYRTENVEAGRLMIYVDRTGPVSDTIRIIIPK